MPTDLVILSDYGLDDAVALAHILEHRDRFGHIDVLAVAGNTSAENSFENAVKLLARAGDTARDVTLVDTSAEPQPWTQLPSIHGKDGLGDLFPPTQPTVPVATYAAWLAVADRPFTLLSLGPCTLTARILARRAQPLVLMAGLVREKPNFNGYEFNHELDKTAFGETVRYPHVIATLDTCRAPVFNMIDKRTAGVTLKEKLIDRAIELAAARHPDNCYIYDYVAAQYLTDPDRFTTDVCVDPWGNVLTQLRAL